MSLVGRKQRGSRAKTGYLMHAEQTSDRKKTGANEIYPLASSRRLRDAWEQGAAAPETRPMSWRTSGEHKSRGKQKQSTSSLINTYMSEDPIRRVRKTKATVYGTLKTTRTRRATDTYFRSETTVISRQKSHKEGISPVNGARREPPK